MEPNVQLGVKTGSSPQVQTLRVVVQLLCQLLQLLHRLAELGKSVLGHLLVLLSHPDVQLSSLRV